MNQKLTLTIHSGELTKAHNTDAGFDIHSSEDTVVYPESSSAISTNLTLTMPPNTIGLVKPRSGTSFANNIETGAGVIDETYSGEIKVKLYNHGDTPFRIKKGQRIAQLVMFYRPSININLQGKDAIFNEPKRKPRGDNGFGSTNIPGFS